MSDIIQTTVENNKDTMPSHKMALQKRAEPIHHMLQIAFAPGTEDYWDSGDEMNLEPIEDFEEEFKPQFKSWDELYNT